ncbi:MAG: hypothetical protein ACFFD1_00885 [Candidatus Thorarchaeota archaeon]
MKISSIIFPIILLVVTGMMLVGNSVYKSDLDYNKVRTPQNLSNYLDELILWNQTYSNQVKENFTGYTNYDVEQITSLRIKRVVNSGVDFLGTSSFELAKFSLEFGYNHPEYNYEYLYNLAKLYLYAIIIIAIFPGVIYLILIMYIISDTIFRGITKIKKRRKKDVEK